MPTEVIHSIRPSGGDYTTLAAWQTAQARNLVTADEIAIAEIYDEWDRSTTGPGGLVFSTSWVCDDDHPVIIRAAAGHEHSGSYTAGAFIKREASGIALSNSSATLHLRLERLVILGYTSTVSVSMANFQRLMFDRLIFDNVASTSIQVSRSINAVAYADIYNCVTFGTGRAMRLLVLSSANGHVRVYNTIAIGSSASFQALQSAAPQTDSPLRRSDFFNCIAINTTNPALAWGLANAPLAASNNASSSYASSPPPGSDPYTEDVTTADFVDFDNQDLRLSDGSGLIGHGVNNFGLFTTDAAGNEWPSSGPWDIGAYHYIQQFLAAWARSSNLPVSGP